jgi:hypothetical protein
MQAQGGARAAVNELQGGEVQMRKRVGRRVVSGQASE